MPQKEKAQQTGGGLGRLKALAQGAPTVFLRFCPALRKSRRTGAGQDEDGRVHTISHPVMLSRSAVA